MQPDATNIRKRLIDIRRSEWILYEWISAQSLTDPHPIYLRGKLRDVNNAVDAGKNWDAFWESWSKEKRNADTKQCDPKDSETRSSSPSVPSILYQIDGCETIRVDFETGEVYRAMLKADFFFNHYGIKSRVVSIDFDTSRPDEQTVTISRVDRW